jgi:O-antigen/teichoic acid export membrane protein
VNLLLRAAAEGAALAFGLASTLWITRGVGPTYFGYYAVTLAIATLGSLVVNAGISTAGAQRVANDPAAAAEALWTVVLARLAIAALAVSAGLAALAVLPIDPIVAAYLRVAVLSWLLVPWRSEWLLIAQGRIRALSVVRALSSAATLLAAVVLVRDVADAPLIAWIPVTGSAVGAVASVVATRRSAAFRRPAGALWPPVGRMMRDGIHYLKADVSVYVFTTSDRLFLYVFATPAVVGLYEAAYRIIQPFYLISSVVGDAMYLQLAQAAGTPRLRPTMRRYVDLMSVATIPLGFFLAAFATEIIGGLYGPQYADASGYLAVLGWVITFGFMSGIAVLPLTGWNRPREYGDATALGGLVNLVLNVALIPRFGGVGAAWATVAAKVAVTLAGVRYHVRTVDYPLVRDFVEYLAMAALAFAIQEGLSFALRYPRAAGIVVFIVAYLVIVSTVRWRAFRASLDPTRWRVAGGPAADETTRS